MGFKLADVEMIPHLGLPWIFVHEYRQNNEECRIVPTGNRSSVLSINSL